MLSITSMDQFFANRARMAHGTYGAESINIARAIPSEGMSGHFENIATQRRLADYYHAYRNPPNVTNLVNLLGTVKQQLSVYGDDPFLLRERTSIENNIEEVLQAHHNRVQNLHNEVLRGIQGLPTEDVM